MTPALVPVAEAALFTLGCMAIHALHRHADVVTAMLAGFATLLILMIGMSLVPESVSKYQTAGIGDFTRGEIAIY